MGRLSVLIACILILISSISISQSNEGSSLQGEPINLTGVHSIYISFGFKMNSSNSTIASASGVKAETNFIGSLGYQYWWDNQWAMNVSAGVFSAEANVEYANVSSISIMPVLFGVSFYPEALTLGRTGRVHFGLNVGGYMGSGTRTGINLNNILNAGTSSVSETVFGAEPNAGIDFFVSKWLRLGPAISYHFVSEFSEVIGNRKNYSGPVFSVNVGVLL
jgi:hypothetical protein